MTVIAGKLAGSPPRWPTRSVMLGAVLALVCSCDTSGIQRDPRTLTVAVPRDLTVLDPAATVIANNLTIVDLAYERLLRYEVRDGLPSGRLLPELAESVLPSEGGRTWTARLAPGHRFDDGSEVTAEAVEFSFARIKKLRLGPSQALVWLQSVSVAGPGEVRFALSQPIPFFDQLLAAPGASIINPRVMAHEVDGDLAAAWLARNTAGSGPYRVTKNEFGERVLLDRNPYAAQPPRWFDRVAFHTLRNPVERLVQLDNGDLDIVDNISPHHIGWVPRREGLALRSGLAPAVFFLQLNNEKPPFNDRRVREALSLAIDRDGMLKAFEEQSGGRLRGFIPEGMPGYDRELPPDRYDPDEARRLLAEAGLRPGTPLEFAYVSDLSAPSPVIVAILAQLEAVGFAVKVKRMSAGARQSLFKGDFQITFQAISLDFPDPWILFTFVYDSQLIGSMGNLSRYRNPELDALLRRADASPPDARAALYREAQRLVLRDRPNVVLYQPVWAVAYRSELQGLDYNFAAPYFYNAEDLWRRAAPPSISAPAVRTAALPERRP